MIEKNFLSTEAIKCILGLNKDLIIDHLDMAKHLKVTFYPHEGKVSENTRIFYSKLNEVFQYYGVDIIPFDKALIKPEHNIIKKGICLIVLGEHDKDHMPIECLPSYRENLILTVMDDLSYVPEGIYKKSFHEQVNYGIKELAWNFSNFIIGVSNDHWVHFAGNGIFDVRKINYNGDFKQEILSTVISKLYAPLYPIPLTEFEILEEGFNSDDPDIAPYLKDMIIGSKLFTKTHLMDYRIKFDELKFKKDVFKKIIDLMLDNRTGAHFGYLSRQLPTKLSDIFLVSDAGQNIGLTFDDRDYTLHNGEIYLRYDLPNNQIFLKVPEVTTLTSISGAEKTNLQPSDIVKMKLKSGKMSLQFFKGIDINKYERIRPSFDTKVIFSHALSNAIYASIMKFYKPDSLYPSILEHNGMALAHWHGYIMPSMLPKSWMIHGIDSPVFMCSAHQAAVYGFRGKEHVMLNSIFNKGYEFLGDIHVEPEHGVNMSWQTLTGLANYLLSSDNIANNGNEYFKYLVNDSLSN